MQKPLSLLLNGYSGVLPSSSIAVYGYTEDMNGKDSFLTGI